MDKVYLIVCPTALEAAVFLENAVRIKDDLEIYSLPQSGKNIELLISGIGIAQTTYSLSKVLLRKKYKLVIHMGIAGAFHKDIPLGLVANIISETFGDMGIETESGFRTFFDLKLMDKNGFPYSEGKMVNKTILPKVYNELPVLQGITVNTLITNKKKIHDRSQKFDVQIESMEGAAVFFTCLKENIDFVEIRAVSNYVGERNKDKWEIKKAIDNLTEAVINFLSLI